MHKKLIVFPSSQTFGNANVIRQAKVEIFRRVNAASKIPKHIFKFHDDAKLEKKLFVHRVVMLQNRKAFRCPPKIDCENENRWLSVVVKNIQ